MQGCLDIDFANWDPDDIARQWREMAGEPGGASTRHHCRVLAGCTAGLGYGVNLHIFLYESHSFTGAGRGAKRCVHHTLHHPPLYACGTSVCAQACMAPCSNRSCCAQR
jgi:hypothetical protein